MKKLNDEQLSRVLSSHDSGRLIRGGLGPNRLRAWGQRYDGCLYQVANADVSTTDLPIASGQGRGARWFDVKYRGWISTDEFLAELEKAGIT